MKFMLLPMFSDIFKAEAAPNRADILSTIPSETVIRVCCHINSQIYFGGDSLDKEIKIFIGLIERIVDDEIRNTYFKNLKEFSQKIHPTSFSIFPITHTLKLIQESLLTYVPPTGQPVTQEQELDILRALLLLNTEANGKFEVQIDASMIRQGHERVYATLWATQLASSIAFLQKEFVIVFYKSLKFIQYLEQHHRNYLDAYIAKLGLDDYPQIVLSLLKFYINGFRREENVFVSFFPRNLIEQEFVIQQLSIELANYDRADYLAKEYNVNFKGFRNLPLVKIENGDLCITNWNFFLDKFYDGLFFDFYNRSGISADFTFGNFKSNVGEKFSNELFMSTMKVIFSNPNTLALTERERNDECDYDFYIRIRNHVFLFEFKDILFPFKESYPEIKNVLDVKLGGNQGTGQLLRHITRLAENPQMYDDLAGYTLDRLFIHPVLVYTDSAYGMTGVNHYLNTVLKDKIPEQLRKRFFRIEPLTMMHFDFILERYDKFKSGEIDLVKIMNSFYQMSAMRVDIQKRFPTVENFVGLFDGFDTIANSQNPLEVGRLVNGTIYEYVIDQLKAHLPEE